MFKLKFKKDDCCKLTVEVDTTECELEKLKREAVEKAEAEYVINKRAAIKAELKCQLFRQYKVESNRSGMQLMHNMSYREGELVSKIIDGMIDDLGLMDD